MKKVAWCVSKWRILQPLSYQPPATQLYTLRGSGLEKSRILALDSWGAHQRKHFSEARLLHLPIPRKVLNSLTWDTWISLLVICWHVRLLGLCGKNSRISYLFPYLFREVPQSHLRGCLQGLSQRVHLIKHNSQLLDCAVSSQPILQNRAVQVLQVTHLSRV